ncbi:F-box protein [Raphanus sativus]|uniref:F-box protein At2g14710-like n=1 Tax=Raphanus sativus TaxID=3726 RepID=A0A6J0MNN2_RAPSA|nr:F-box protein At2g14710-like [Raphanus sativus]KAJ4907035.1 F-box protein [Raphanus sativus]
MKSNIKKQKSEIAAHEEKLPWELIEEILLCVSPKSLVCFRVVCKRWKAILDDKTFIYNHKETFRFILATKSKIYSVSVDPKIVVRELSLDIPGLEARKPKKLVSCDEFMICSMDNGAAVCNPWLKQSTWISEPTFHFHGICHLDSNGRSEESVYKTIWGKNTVWKTHDLASGTWKDIESMSGNTNQGEQKFKTLHSPSGVLLNGTLFWIVFSVETVPLYHLDAFDLSRERFYRFCDLPCVRSNPQDALVLRVFKGDRFSVLKQCSVTKKIEIWVTENKVEKGAGVVWMILMTFSIPNFPCLAQTAYIYQPSYFIDNNKRLVVCSCDETGKAWIYVMAENKLISKVQISSVVDSWPLHCTYFPSLIPVPQCHGDET